MVLWRGCAHALKFLDADFNLGNAFIIFEVWNRLSSHCLTLSILSGLNLVEP